MINIVFITDSLVNLNGAERNLFEIVTRLDRKRFNPVVMGFKSGLAAEKLRENGIEVVDLQIGRIYSLPALVKAARFFSYLKSKKIDLVVTYHEGSDFWAGATAWLAGIPVRISSRRDMGYKLKKSHILMYRMVNNKLFTRIIAVSNAVRNVIFEREHTLWSKIVTIPNGTDIARFNQPVDPASAREKLGILSNSPVVGIISGLRPIKGLENFIKSAARVKQENPDARFLIVGWSGDKKYREKLFKLTDELGIREKVIFAGQRDDIPQLLAVMDIFVNSSYNEGFSNAIIEAMAASKPVIATNGGGNPEAVIPGETGILVPPEDDAALAEAVIKLLEDPQIREKMAVAGREKVESEFSVELMVEREEKLFERLLEERRGRHLRIYPFWAIKTFGGMVREIFVGSDRGLRVLAYHRVANESFDPLCMSVSEEKFEKQMRLIRGWFKPLTLKETIRIIEAGEEFPPRSVLVTFDDGYADVYTNAWPILQKYGVPAVVFLSTQAIEDKGLLWYDKVVESFRMTRKKHIEFPEFKMKFSLKNISRKKNAARSCVFFAKKLSEAKQKEFFGRLAAGLEVSEEKISRRKLMLDWEQARRMSQSGIEFGDHGLSHSILSGLRQPELEQEIRESKLIIRERLREADVSSFAYPNGLRGDYNDAVKDVLRRNGYKVAFSLSRGINNGGIDPLEIKRYCLSEGFGSDPLGGFSRNAFIFDLLR